MAVGVVQHILSFLDAVGLNLIDPLLSSFTTTYTNKYRVDLNITATPTSYAVNNVIGASPVALYIYNPTAVAVTMAGNQVVAMVIPALKGIFLPQFDTTGQLTLSTASGTGTVNVLLLK